MSKRIDAASRMIDAPPATVYRAFAEPEAMIRWLPPDGMRGRLLEFDFREGGGYRIRLMYQDPTQGRGKTSEDADEVAVRFSRLIPDRSIEQRVDFESTDPAFAGEMRMTWDLEPRGAGTLVSVRCEDVPEGIAPEDHAVGLRSTLRNLAAHAEGRHHASEAGDG